jgi:hypothetical protein
MRPICHLVDEDQRTSRFQCLRQFFQHISIDLRWQQVSNMEVEGYIVSGCKIAGEIILHNVGAEKAHAIRHASLQRGTFAGLDACLNIQDSGAQLGIFATEKYTICRV